MRESFSHERGLLSMMIKIFRTAVLAASLHGASALMSGAAKPNIVILYSDDAGYADFGFQPHCVEEMKKLTPNIDSIAKDGVRLSSAYMSGCVCSPSRAGLMTGRYQQQFGYDNNLPPGAKTGLPLTEKFGAKRLKELGYSTALIGKWHLGYPAEMHPNKRGFDWFYGLLQGSRGYFPYQGASPHRVILENSAPTREQGYVTDRFGDAACKFISENKAKPFYLFVSFTAPHSPNQPKEEDKKRAAHISKKSRAAYAGLIVSLDDNVGKILKHLEKEGLSKNTLVIFTNDNGGQTATGANNAPLQGKKGTLLEGGVRVPWAMRWPGKIQPGTVIDDPIISLDILPTIVEMSGNTVDPAWQLNGVSFYDRMTGKTDALGKRPLFWRQHGSRGDRAMRLGKWKLHDGRSSGTGIRLFNLEKDISESTDLSAKEPVMTKTLTKMLDLWESGLKEPLWGHGSPGYKGGKKGKRGRGKKKGARERRKKQSAQ